MLTIIGDVHGKYQRYVDIIYGLDHPSIQLGDMGFNYDTLEKMIPAKIVDNHKFFGGNHDNYDTIDQSPLSLGDYGLREFGGLNVLWIRGAFSIDWQGRVAHAIREGKSWWEREQLNIVEAGNAFSFYMNNIQDADVVVTHTCPEQISKMIGNPGILRDFGFNPDTFTTLTQNLLQQCFNFYQPKLWVFGHFHKSWEKEVAGTKFRCLGELEPLTIG